VPGGRAVEEKKEKFKMQKCYLAAEEHFYNNN
jgi:hypothetical protein